MFSGLKKSLLYPVAVILALTCSSLQSKTFENYHPIGCSFTVDGNGAFFLETQDPHFTVKFVGPNGQIRTKRFQAKINTVGMKIELAIKLDAIFIVGTDSRFYNAHTIELGTGIDLNTTLGAGVSFTYVPFRNMPGGMVMIGLPFLATFPSLSLVTGGTLTALD